MVKPDPRPNGIATTLDAFLGGRLVLLQPESGYRAGLDAVLLAATVPAPAVKGEPAAIADLGAGVGAVGLAAVTRLPGLRAVMVERESALAALARENIIRNGLDDRASVIVADLEAPARELETVGFAADRFDYVVANPPFQIEGDGHPPPDPLKARAHVMPTGGVERWVRTMARLTRPGGTATMIHRADALPGLLAAFAGRFGALSILPIHPRAGEPAGRVIIAGRKGSRAPLSLLPGLVVHAAQGHGFSPMLEAILRHGAGLDLWARGAPLLVPMPHAV